MKLSACMMVKNEEINIERCLNSLGFVDEIIIFDTGSTDKTIDLIQKRKDDRIKLFYSEWQNNFSYHRNESISKATGDWVFIVDADEEVILQNTKENLLLALETIEKQDVFAMQVNLCDIQKGKNTLNFLTPRFFKNGEIEYKGIVHNQPNTKNNHAASCDYLFIKHYGYDLSPEKDLAKKERTLGLLHKMLDEEPENKDTLFYLCQIHSKYNEDSLAILYGKQYIEKENPNDSVFFTLFYSYLKNQDTEEALKVLNMGLNKNPENLDLWFAFTKYVYETEKNIAKAFSGAMNFISCFDKLKEDISIAQNQFLFCFTPEHLLYCLDICLNFHSFGLKLSLQKVKPLIKGYKLLSKKIKKDIFNQ